jgi:hypothetical protein
MLAMPGVRTFSLSPGRDSNGVSCDTNGAFVAGISLLKSAHLDARTSDWIVRPVAEINEELSARYRLPIDVSPKAGALALIAKALNRSDFAMAAIATVQMQFPDPPPLAQRVESSDALMRRALELHRSRLLKVHWDPANHPRAGTPPNSGWFAPVEHRPKTPVRVAANGPFLEIRPIEEEGDPRENMELPFPHPLQIGPVGGAGRLWSPSRSSPKLGSSVGCRADGDAPGGSTAKTPL